MLFPCSKCQKYSPTESNKANDKATNRKGGIVFDPQQVVDMVKQEAISGRTAIMPKDDCIKQYLEVKRPSFSSGISAKVMRAGGQVITIYPLF